METPISTTIRSPENREERDELARAFASREAWAFESAYRLYGKMMLGAAAAVLHDAHAAEDCVHEVIARLWRVNAYREARGSLAAFLTICARNEALSRARRDANRSRIERRMQIADRYEAPFGDPVERANVARAIRDLNEDQRRVLDLAYGKHMTHQEIAGELRAPLGTIKSRLSNALRSLRAALDAGETS